MFSIKNKQFIYSLLTIVSIAAFVGFVLVDEGPVNRGSGSSGRAKRTEPVKQTQTPQAKAEPSNTQTVQPEADESVSTQPATEDTGATQNQVAKTPTSNSRGGKSSSKSAGMEAHELFALMDSEPQSISMITFHNGSDKLTVRKVNDNTSYYVTVPDGGGKEAVIELAREKKIAWSAKKDGTASLRGFFFSFGPILLIGAIFLFIYSRSRKAGSAGMGNFGKSKAISAEAENANVRKVTFDDVAGCDQAIKELKRIARGLKRRKLYSFFGAKLPKGVILTGPPGTGKTLLARAVAGVTDGTFSSTSGSDFVEMFVGVGASRVRDVFEDGRKKVKETGKPHIIFIDEIDAVGGKRGGGTGESSNSEREQTLNAILVEMDGMKNNEGLIVIAATNRLDMLDTALMRPGRFDSQVTVDNPNKEGRAAIFAIHTRNKPLAEDVNCDILAARSFGYSGAEIEGACNRAALLAAERYGLEIPEDATEEEVLDALKEMNATISLSEFDEGVDFVRYGSADPAKQKAMAEDEKNNTAVHEAGHACVSEVMPGSDPVVKITIMNRSKALGYVQNMPGEDRYGLSVEQLVARMVMAMAGRAAQEVILGKSDTGASNDFEQASQMAYNMVTKWGMSRLGHISVGRGGTGMQGFGSGPVSNFGPKLADRIDEEWMRIAEECYKLAKTIVEKDKARIEKLAKVLMEKETVLQDEWANFTSDNPSNLKAEDVAFDPSAKEEGDN